jgi:hypothetical protein
MAGSDEMQVDQSSSAAETKAADAAEPEAADPLVEALEAADEVATLTPAAAIDAYLRVLQVGLRAVLRVRAASAGRTAAVSGAPPTPRRGWIHQPRAEHGRAVMGTERPFPMWASGGVCGSW